MDLKINKNKFKIFLEIAKILNKFEIVPVLYGSLGLYCKIGEFGKSSDVDILIPDNFLKEKWTDIIDFMESIGFKIINEKEHEFVREDEFVAFGHQEDLIKKCNIHKGDLEERNIGGIKFKELSPDQYLLVYNFMLRDKYRQEKREKK